MFRPALIHLFCVCIGADSADSTFSVTDSMVIITGVTINHTGPVPGQK